MWGWGMSDNRLKHYKDRAKELAEMVTKIGIWDPSMFGKSQKKAQEILKEIEAEDA